MRRFVRITGVVGVALSLTGCDDPGHFVGQLKEQLNALQIILRGGQSPLAKHPEPKPSTRSLTTSEVALRPKKIPSFCKRFSGWFITANPVIARSLAVFWIR